ncbi:hypothetical protein OEZ86_002173 [Tetradesmus obliquus]|nr:hypothetical protein OEZ86_002173 [Tetradesmus obliquus]
MAFVSRSERDTSVPAPRSTTDKVGPGSYSLLPARKFIPAAAPFASNTKRAIGTSSSSGHEHSTSKASSSSSIPASLAAGGSGQQAADEPCVAHTDSVRNFRHRTKSSSFASSTKRFSTSKETTAKPGPGAYQTVPKWISSHGKAPLYREAASKKVSELLGTATAAVASVALAGVQSASSNGSKAAEVPVLTPPSIPARHQSYGYEQGPGGLLVMQPPPQLDGTAGEAAVASSGPAATCPGSVQGKAKGTAWAASRTDRWGPHSQQHLPQRQRLHPQRQHQQQPQSPGPATYRVDSSATRFRLSPDGRLVPCRVSGRGSFSAAGSAAFMSRVARPHQTEPDPDKNTPGPGTYLQQQRLRPQSAPQPAAAGFTPAHSSQHQQQLFGQGPGRECAIAGLPGVMQPSSVAPGPGTYDLSKAGSLTKTVRSSRAGLLHGSGVTTSAVAATVHADQDAGQTAAGFGSTSNRFGDANVNSPGPGKYSADQAASMAADAAKKAAAASRRGVFGSAAERFSSGSNCGANSAVAAAASGATAGGGACSALGPGAYDVDCGVARHVAAAAARPSPGFVSSSQRFAPAAAPAAAPDYSSWDGEPGSLRGDAGRLGPGAYVKLEEWGGKAAARSSTAGGCCRPSYHSVPFGSEAPRSSPLLAAAGAGHKGATPGPGAYDKATVEMRQVFRPLSMPGSAAGFSTGSRRFGSSTSVSPGPGAYTEDTANSCSLVRPSYNVTLDC